MFVLVVVNSDCFNVIGVSALVDNERFSVTGVLVLVDKECFNVDGVSMLVDKECFNAIGVSVLVDKDQSPKWNPDTLEGVTPEKLDWYFSPLPPDRELVL